MTLIFYKLLAALLIFAVGMVTAIYPIWRQRVSKPTESAQLGEALASGIFLGAAFFHMLPDAIQSFHESYSNIHYPIPELICVCGFLLLLFLERLSLTRPHQHTSGFIPVILIATLIIHAVTEGAALGIGLTWEQTTMLFIAILAHKGTDSFAFCVVLLKYNFSFRKLLWLVTLFALTTPIGIFLGTLLSEATVSGTGQMLSIGFNAFAAGTFLYISTLHHMHFHSHAHEKQGMLEFACLAAGVAAMGLIAVWA